MIKFYNIYLYNFTTYIDTNVVAIKNRKSLILPGISSHYCADQIIPKKHRTTSHPSRERSFIKRERPGIVLF